MKQVQSTTGKRRLALCVGCGSQIHDQYILRVAPDLEWHAACLKCADCHQFLDETCTCFVREGKTYCKRDYVRLFGTKCSKCSSGFSKTDFVMRARTNIYHIDCFRCVACSRQLIPGDEFALREDGLFCKADHEVLEKASDSSGSGGGGGGGGGGNNGGVSGGGGSATSHNGVNGGNGGNGGGTVGNCGNGGHPESNGGLQLAGEPHRLSGHSFSSSLLDPHHCSSSSSANAEPMVNSRPGRDSVRPQVHKNPEQKTTRVRTVLNEKQLHTLRTCYAANPRPDALMKEQLVEMTGLSPRVIRVWFQNKRCKDKKRSIMMKQLQQQEKFLVFQDGRRVPGLGGMQGVPMIATSPVRHESPLQVSPVEVQAYQPPWKALSEFALQADLERIDPGAPAFQQLVSQFLSPFQMHGYTDADHMIAVAAAAGQTLPVTTTPTPTTILGVVGSGGGGSGGAPSYLSANEDSLQHAASDLSSHCMPGSPSELSSQGSD